MSIYPVRPQSGCFNPLSQPSPSPLSQSDPSSETFWLFNKNRGQMLIHAAEDNDEKSIQAILSDFPLEEKDRTQAVIAAIRNGNLPLIKKLLPNGPFFNIKGTRGFMIIEAVKVGRLDILEYLFPDYTIVPNDQLFLACQEAAARGDLPILQFLTKNRKSSYKELCAIKDLAQVHSV